MAFLEQLLNPPPLKKTPGIVHDASRPDMRNTLEISDKYDKSVIQANIENWSEILRDFTPHTLLVPLSQSNARLLQQAYENLEKRPEAVSVAAKIFVSAGVHVGTLNEEEDALLASLSSSIDSAIAQLSVGQGCFMKLSSRSPKDAAARSGVFERFYREAYYHGLDENSKIRILCEAESSALRFKDAASVIRALILSERVWQDLILAFRHPEDWNLNIVFRSWEPVPIDMEFRTFVSSNRMTCISQYAYQLHSLALTDPGNLATTVEIIKTFFEENLRPILAYNGFEDYVLDIGIIPSERRAILIEMNPFEETTDGALFSWTEERDLIEGKRMAVYPVVRITERPRTGSLVMLPKSWKTVVEKVEKDHHS
ncbi:D123-domain-containing protein [Flagelloscypha sp. PMI_526]|nr:D123-domain-containing protein [Flagelloscypha sp. PMI_526]